MFNCYDALSAGSNSSGRQTIGSEKRIALIIGNQSYKNENQKLRNSVKDAKDLSRELKELGFEVTLRTNRNLKQMVKDIREFGDKLKSDVVGLFYYSGHGVQVDGKNFLLPVDAEEMRKEEIAELTVSFDLILTKMKIAQNDKNIIILDTCRTNPSDTNDGHLKINNLASEELPKDSHLIYAANSNQPASDGAKGKNGIFMEYFLKHISTPGIDIFELMQKVTGSVLRATGHKQNPIHISSSSSEKKFYFIPTNGQDSGREPIVIKPKPELIFGLKDYAIIGVGLASGFYAYSLYSEFNSLKEENEDYRSEMNSPLEKDRYDELSRKYKSNKQKQEELKDPMLFFQSISAIALIFEFMNFYSQSNKFTYNNEWNLSFSKNEINRLGKKPIYSISFHKKW